jgi:hypothetical protein
MTLQVDEKPGLQAATLSTSSRQAVKSGFAQMKPAAKCAIVRTKEFFMRHLAWLRSSLIIAATIGFLSPVSWAAEGVIFRNPDASGQFCHLRFPAIREETLSWDRPVLKDPDEGDIIDFYGPCDHDPLGRAEVLRQRADARRWRDRYDGETD